MGGCIPNFVNLPGARRNTVKLCQGGFGRQHFFKKSQGLANNCRFLIDRARCNEFVGTQLAFERPASGASDTMSGLPILAELIGQLYEDVIFPPLDLIVRINKLPPRHGASKGVGMLYSKDAMLLDRQFQKQRDFQNRSGIASRPDKLNLRLANLNLTVRDFHGTAAFIEHIAIDLPKSGGATKLDAKT